jgi:hypothetical protein
MRLATPLAGVVATVALSLASGCVSSQSPEDRSRACRGLADDVSGVDLDGSPTVDQATNAGLALDSRLSQLRDPSIHDPAVRLHSNVHRIQSALEDGDTERAAEATRAARTAALQAADACDLSPADFGL